MVQAARQSGTADRRAVFELFPRRLPPGRRYGVVAGVGRALDAIEDFRFDAAALTALEGVVDPDMLDWLGSYRFSGDVWGYAEGEAYFPYSPLLVVEGTFAEAVLLETVLLSVYNHDSAIASAASRMTLAAGDRPCIEMGSRRTHEEAAVAAARAAYVAGFDASSNLAARARYGVPSTGTAAHSFTLLHDAEADAFRAQVQTLGVGTTLLVDTYDVAEAVRLAVEVAGTGLGAVRLDSGDLGEIAREVRAQLDGLGASTHPDRGHQRPRRARHRRPRGGAGRRLRRGDPAGHRLGPPDVRLRLQAGGARGRRRRAGVGRQEVDGQAVDRRAEVRPAPARPERGRRGRGRGHRRAAGGRRPLDGTSDRALLVPLVRDGEVVGRATLDEARARHRASVAELPRSVTMMSAGEPVIPTVHLGP